MGIPGTSSSTVEETIKGMWRSLSVDQKIHYSRECTLKQAYADGLPSICPPVHPRPPIEFFFRSAVQIRPWGCPLGRVNVFVRGSLLWEISIWKKWLITPCISGEKIKDETELEKLELEKLKLNPYVILPEAYRNDSPYSPSGIFWCFHPELTPFYLPFIYDSLTFLFQKAYRQEITRRRRTYGFSIDPDNTEVST